MYERYYGLQERPFDLSPDPHIKIHNTQILHYSRRDPATGAVAPYLNWMRSVCPWDLNLSSNEWRPIVRKKYSNADLLELVQRTPRLRPGSLNPPG